MSVLAERPGRLPSALEVFVSRMGRYSAIFGIGLALQLLLGVATTAAVTHYLSPAEYGHLALYLIIPSLMMVVCNLGTLPGTMRAVFGYGGDDGDGDVVDEVDTSTVAMGHEGHDVRVVFCTGALLTLGVAVVVGAILMLFAAPLGHAIGGTPQGPELVRIGIGAGVLGSQWRLLGNFQRYARRPVRYVVVHVSRGIIGLVATVILVASGGGVAGAMIGICLGTAGAVIVAIIAAASDLRPGFDREAARRIPRLGASWIIVALSFHAVQTLGVMVVAAYAGAAAAGNYSLAQSLARVGAYAVTIFLYGWGPILRSPLRTAVARERGLKESNALVLNAYPVGAAFVFLCLGLVADWLVRIAPASFGSAAGLVALLAAIPMARGFFSLAYATSTHPNRRRLFIILVTVTPFIFAGGSLLLGPVWGGAGIGASSVVSFLVPGIAMLVISQRAGDPLPLVYRQLLLPMPLAAGLLLLIETLGVPTDAFGALVRLAAAVVFVLVLLITHTIPLQAVTIFARPVGLLSYGRQSRRALAQSLDRLMPEDAGLVYSLVRRRESASEVARRRGEPEDAVVERFLVVMRALSDVDPRQELPDPVGDLLLHRGPAARRLALSDKIMDDGADPLAVDRLEQTTIQLRVLPRHRWPVVAE